MTSGRAAPPPSPPLAPERLQLVLELGRRVTSLLDLQRLLPEACRLIAEAFAYDLVGINLLDPLDDQRLYQAAAHPPARLLPRSFRVPLGRGLTGWVARHGRPRLSNDVRRDPQYVAGPGRRTRSELDVPLKVGQRTIGVLNIESERPGAFTEEDIPYLEGLAGQLAQAIENARLAARARQLAASEERARLARDLHDETAQALVAIGRQLDLLLLDLDERGRAEARIEALHRLVDRSLDGVRRLSRNLRPAVLEDLGLVAALRAHVEELERLGLRVDVVVAGGCERLPSEVAYAVYRVAQEALSNVARHAGTAEARLELRCSPDELELLVSDRGGGFRLAEQVGRADGQGLVNMRDRAAEIGAELTIRAAPGEGTTIRLWVPLALTLLEAPE
jgi:two-component system, NarL family, sensor kinase